MKFDQKSLFNFGKELIKENNIIHNQRDTSEITKAILI